MTDFAVSTERKDFLGLGISHPHCVVRCDGQPRGVTERIVARKHLGFGASDVVTTKTPDLFVFGVGVLGQPHMLHKFYMLDDPRKLKWIPLVFGSTQGLCFLVWIGVGVAVPALVADGQLPPLDHPDAATPLFLLQFAPKVLAGIVFAGILAADVALPSPAARRVR